MAELQVQMERALNDSLPLLPDQWKVSWGPVVYKGPLTITGPQNVWYVATSDSLKLCVVAIAGTALYNYVAWETIDCEVNKIVDFDQWTSGWSSIVASGRHISNPSASAYVEGKSFVAMGTCIGLTNLLSNAPSATAVLPGKYIYDYLKDDVPEGYQIVFTGHSMGGALSPSLALGLAQANIPGLDLGSAQVYASAGPSPGNQTFTDNFAQLFPPGTEGDYTAPNTDFFSENDVVPQAWGISSPADRNLERIRSIYSGAGAPARAFLNDQVTSKEKIAKASGMDYVPIPGTSFPGSPVNHPILPPGLVFEIARQHGQPYRDNIGISDFIDFFRKKFAEEATPTEEELDALYGKYEGPE